MIQRSQLIEIRLEAEDLMYDYVQCIDDGQLEQWPDFFVDDCDYRVIPRENADAGLPAAIISCEGKGMLRDRIVALREANGFPQHHTRHVVSNTRVLRIEDNIIHTQSNYVVLQTRIDGETFIFNAGRYVDEIVRTENQLRYRKKHCIFDTNRITSLMVTPI